MQIEQGITVAMLLVLLAFALVSDLRHQRIPNLLILLGLVLGLVGQVYSGGISGLGDGVLAMLVGFAVFIPLYALGGMAAGDVKLMAMTGVFLTPSGALWAALFSLAAGGLCGFLLVLMHGQIPQTLARYCLMLRARVYLAPATDEVMGKPFPYAIAILLGTLTSIFWPLFGQ